MILFSMQMIHCGMAKDVVYSLEGACCAAPGLPWFHKTLDNTTTDYIELRVCGDEGTENEDTPIAFYEIYIK